MAGEPLLPPLIQAGLLVLIAGYADAIGFLRYNAFAGQMSGNTILLGISAFEATWADTVHLLAVIGCFVLGLFVSAGLGRFGLAPAMILTLAAAVVAACAFIGRGPGGPMLAFAMGLQSAAATRFGAAKLNTVFITGDLQRLFEGLVAWLWPSPGVAAPAGLGPLTLVWLEYALGALLGALVNRVLPHALLLPAIVMPFVLVHRPRPRGV